MTLSPQLVIYTLEFCPNCELLKEYLTHRGVPFTERDMRTPASLTELRVNGVFVQEAPVLQHQSSFLTSRDLFSSGTVREDQVNRLIEGV